MNDFESSLSTALVLEAQAVAAVVNTNMGARDLRARLDRADLRRRRTRWVAALVVAGAAAIVIGFAVISHSTGRAVNPGPAKPSPTGSAAPSPSQSTRPSPRATPPRSTALGTTLPLNQSNQPVLPQPPGRPPFVLSAQPLMARPDWMVGLGQDPIVVTSQRLPVLTPCHTDPFGWGAVQVVAADYANSNHPELVANEYVLRFVDTAHAHQAVSDLRLQMAHCPTPPEVAVDPGSKAVYRTYKFDESYVTQRSTFTDQSMLGDPIEVYALRVGRQGNVVVIVEDTGYPADRTGVTLMLALHQAIGG